ncbi:hypothetical protein GGI23_000429 [Coemansia sp. RSA 2559]|nr:hypothetical protein GGI23_000429 [Coemansia sp. RSA 2559]KAJ2869153.1 hypothetical protein GGI22_000426 [Coemansia erecta]
MKAVYSTTALQVQSTSLAVSLPTGTASIQSIGRKSTTIMNNGHANDIHIGFVQVVSPIDNTVPSAAPIPMITEPIWLSQDNMNAHVHIAPMPSSFSLEVALESPYVFDIVGAKVSLKPSMRPVVSSVLRLESDLEPPHPRQTAPPPEIFRTQVLASVTGAEKSTTAPDSETQHGYVHTKTETVVVVGSQIPKSEATNKSTIPSPPPVNNPQGLASELSRSGIQLRLSNANSLIYAMPTYFHAATPLPTPSRQDTDAYVPGSRSVLPTPQEDSSSLPVYSTNPSEKRLTNGNGNNYPGNKPYKLADGFICLIIIGLVFILATLFYLFMRYRRKQRSRRGPGINGSDSSSKLIRGPATSSGPSSKQSSLSNGNSYQHRRPQINEKHQRHVPDSGTDIANRHNKQTGNSEKAFQDCSTAAITMYPLLAAPTNRHTEHERIIQIDEQDGYTTRKIDQAYRDYRTKGTAANAEKQADVGLANPLGFAKAYTQEPKASNGARWAESRNEPEKGLADKHIQVLREPAKVLLSASSGNSRHSPSSLESKLPEIRLYMPDKNKLSAGYAGKRDTAQHKSAAGTSNRVGKKNILLDTSSVNPGMSPLKSDGLQGQLHKPRKLVRGSTKRDKISSSSPSKDGEKKARSADHTSSMSLRAMFRSPQTNAKDAQKGKGTQPKEYNNAADSSDSDTDRQDINEMRRGEQLVTESIESISDNYQLAVRHKPPLGPLRAVEPHIPVLPDELVVERSDRMYVFGEFADGWVLAMNISRRSDLGMVPRRCIFFPTAPFMTDEAIMASRASLNPEESHARINC